MAIMLPDGIDRDTAKQADQFDVHPVTQVPGDRGVAERVANDSASLFIGSQPGILHHRGPAILDDAHRLAIPFDHRTIGYAEPLPPPHVREQAGGNWDGRLPFAGFLFVVGLSLEDALVEIDIAAPNGRDYSRTA